MGGTPPAGPPPSTRLPSSDPAAESRAPPWADLRVSSQPNAYHADGAAGPLSWTDLMSRATQAFGECGLVVADEQKPQFHRASTFFGPPGQLGYGWIAGEAGLQLAERTFYGDNYSSFIASLQFWVDPPLPKGSDDAPELPHLWKIRVGVGQILSTARTTRHSGPVRLFLDILPTDPGTGWVTGSLLKHFQ